MNTNNLIKLISYRPIKVKEIISKIDELTTSNFKLDLFIINNPQITVSEFEVASELMNLSTILINKRIPLNIVKNVYDEYSIIFVILMLQNKKNQSKLQKIYIECLSNTNKFDKYTKVTKNLKKIGSADDINLEIFWLIPLFSNVKLLSSFDYKSFINEMTSVGDKIPGFVEGYDIFVTSNISFNASLKNDYKTHLVECIKIFKESV